MVRPPILPTVNEANVTMSDTSEIPDNVTAELEKLEQEGGAPTMGAMVEVENVSAILGDLADDDDELLGESNIDPVRPILLASLITSNKCIYFFPANQLKWARTSTFSSTRTRNWAN